MVLPMRPPKAWSLFPPGVARRLVVCIIFFFSIFLFPVAGVTSVVDETLEGDAKLAQGEIQEAEKHYAMALKMDPGNWRVMRSLAEVRFKLKKYKETKPSVLKRKY